jgi:hypothetical protein
VLTAIDRRVAAGQKRGTECELLYSLALHIRAD